MVARSNVLVIDDEEIICESCNEVLMQEGYEVDTANDGPSGLRKVRELRPDLVLVDLKMPGMSGMEVLEKIKEMDQNIVTIVITGYATIESAVEAVKRGAYDFIPKPFTPGELRLIVRRGFEMRRLAVESAALREEKERMKRNFITMVSHELKSPLAAVQQYLEVILGGMAGKVSEEQKRIIVRMSVRIQNLLALINKWLDMARIEAGTLVERFEPVDVAPLIRESVDSVQLLARERNVRLELAIADSLPLILGDNETMCQVFTNLLVNAIRYNRENGRVRIETGEEGVYLTVRVCDTGVGISEEDLPFIFDEFFRVKSSAKDETTGSGLGLSIVQRIVEAHRGHVKVTSQPNEGSVFTVYLPKADRQRP